MNLYEMLKYDEGEKLSLYKDTEGYWTIGVGHLVTKKESKDEAIKILGSDTITKEQSVEFFEQDVARSIQSIEKSELNKIYTKMNEARQYALVNMVYQLGLNGVLAFKRMIKYLENGDYSFAASESLDSKWARQTPNRACRVSSVMRSGTLSAYN